MITSKITAAAKIAIFPVACVFPLELKSGFAVFKAKRTSIGAGALPLPFFLNINFRSSVQSIIYLRFPVLIARFVRKHFFTDFSTFFMDLRLGELCYSTTEPETVISHRKK